MGLRKNIGRVGALEVRDYVVAEIGRVPKQTPPDDAGPGGGAALEQPPTGEGQSDPAGPQDEP